MTFSIGGGFSLGNNNNGGFIDLNQGGLMQTKERAIIFVFEPFQNSIGDVAHRSNQYSFDENFLNTMQQVTEETRRGTATESQIIGDLNTKINLSDNMLPAYRPTWNIRTSALSMNWRFILMLTQNGGEMALGNTLVNTGGGTSARRIYTGFFTDEPFNPLTFREHHRTLNPNAQLVITHKTVIGTATAYTQHGPRTDLASWGSEDIVQPQILKDLIGGGMAGRNHINLLTPESCLTNTQADEDGGAIITPGASNILEDRVATVIPDALDHTHRNVSHVIGGIVKYQDQMNARQNISGSQNIDYFEDAFLNDGVHRNAFARHLSMRRTSKNNIYDLDENRPISIGEIDQMVNGRLEVMSYGIRRPDYYETADQYETSMTNQYSHLIATVTVAIMNAASVNAMAFEYEIMHAPVTPLEKFIPYSAETAFNADTNMTLMKQKAVEVELRNTIFRTIYDSKGSFHVAVNANATGITSVSLSLIDQGIRCHAPFELPSMFGGIISPLLGDTEASTHNSEQIEGLFKIATGANQPPQVSGHLPYFGSTDFGALD